ncbi:MAG TPA: hypothetical protein VLA16_13980 [Ideonella sp.]|nr:hypothetical protein [Ideonella sp.]
MSTQDFCDWRRALAQAARVCLLVAALGTAALPASAQAPSRKLAPGFTQLAPQAKLLVLPVDVELFSLSAGGVAEPKAEWTAAAHQHMQAALQANLGKRGLGLTLADDALADEFAEQLGVQAAVMRSIAQHHAGADVWALPTKQGLLDWSLDDTMQGLQAKTGADYGLFVWVRDSYASTERKVAMAVLALVGVGVGGGVQVGYASLVDLRTGRVLWFSLLARGSGDLREADPAHESVEALLAGFPAKP